MALLWGDTRHAIQVVTPAAAEPVAYAEAKAHLRLSDDTDLDLVTALIRAARAKIESDTGRRLISQTWDLLFDAFPRDAIRPPLVPLRSVSVSTRSAAGVETTVASSTYLVDAASVPGRVVLAAGKAWPTDLQVIHGITVRCVCGYGDTSATVPDPLRQAALQLVTHWYRHRDAAAYPPLPVWFGYDAMINPYRVIWMA